MKHIFSYIVYYTNYISRAIARYTGNITDPGTQIMWGIVLFLLLLLLVVHKSHKKRKAVLNTSAVSLVKKADRLAKTGDFIHAAKLYEKGGNISLAADLYYKAGAVYYASQLYKKTGMKEKQAAVLEQIGFYKEAGELYRELSMYKQAGENLLKAGELLKAAGMLETTGEIEKAADAYMSAGFNLRAGELYTKLGDRAKAAPAYEASVILSKGNILPRAITNYALRSAAAYSAVGNIEKAAEVTEKAGLAKQAAALYAKLENWAKASELYILAGNKKLAAEIMEKAGWHEKSSLVMASYYEEKDMKRDAIQLYEKMGRFDDVARLYGSIGEKLKAAEFYSKAGKSLVAASIFKEMGYIDKALSTLESASKTEKQTKEAEILKFDLLMEKGLYKDARAIVEKLLAGKVPTASNVPLYYRLAGVYEEEGKAKEAVTIYSKLIKLDSNYMDVKERMERLKRILETPSPSAIDQYAQTILLPREGESVLSKRYKLIEELGRGGMGIVIKAQDAVLGRTVAIKLMSTGGASDPKWIDAFIREARTSASLNHPNIVTVYDVGEDKGAFYIVMEYVEGMVVKKLLEEYPNGMPTQLAIFISVQMLKGLAYAHEKGIIHRDVKPSNIMWMPKRVVKLMDFGLAKAMEEIKHGETIVGGTPLYMSPEQILGEKTDARTDIYSFGCTLYELLSGSPPFMHGDIGYHQVHTAPKPLTDIGNHVPEWLSDIVIKCLNKLPERRYMRVEQLFSDIQKGYKSASS